MRLLEFPCGRRAPRPEEAAPRTEKVAAAAAAAKGWEGKRRRRASPWRPSLVAISEDGALVAGNINGPAKGGGGGGPSKASAKSTTRLLPRPFKDDYWHYRVPTLMPAFAPTAFIF